MGVILEIVMLQWIYLLNTVIMSMEFILCLFICYYYCYNSVARSIYTFIKNRL